MSSRSRAAEIFPRAVLAGALALAVLGFSGCASQRASGPPPPIPEPVLPGAPGDVRGTEERIESSSVMPSAPLGLAPRRVTSVATSWPADAAADQARPISALARGGTDGAAGREVVYALSIAFPAGSVTLTDLARTLLDQLAARLNLGDSVFYLEVQGHADSSGTDATNMAVALQRAQAVRDYLLVASGLPPSRIAVVSLGAGQPIADNDTPTGRARNRRVVVLTLR